MKKTHDIMRKALATIISVSVMCAMLWFAYTMLISTPIFEGTLRLVLMLCIGALTLATVYFFICKIMEMISLLRGPSKKELAAQAQQAQTAKTE